MPGSRVRVPPLLYLSGGQRDPLAAPFMTDTTARPFENNTDQASASAPPRILERNVRALVEHAAQEERAKPASDRIATAIWRFAGTMKFVYLHVLVFGFWALLDAGWIAGIKDFDPDFTILGT